MRNLTEKEFKTVFIFLDTDKYASPFDMLVTTDAFPDSMIFKYENVNSEDAARIVYDTVFPRGPEGAKHTKIFVNGKLTFLAIASIFSLSEPASKGFNLLNIGTIRLV